MSIRAKQQRNDFIKQVILPSTILIVLVVLVGGLFMSIGKLNILQAKLDATESGLSDLTDIFDGWELEEI